MTRCVGCHRLMLARLETMPAFVCRAMPLALFYRVNAGGECMRCVLEWDRQ